MVPENDDDLGERGGCDGREYAFEESDGVRIAHWSAIDR